jgi:bifunctional DNA-binding transcriptional regulator/antitoxin component of YhaV-PrlF toxin-antitoxin module
MTTEMIIEELPIKMGASGRASIPWMTRKKLALNSGDYLLITIVKVIKRTEEKEIANEELE